MPHRRTRTIIGIDPGYGRIGVGVIRQDGAQLSCVSYECLMPPKAVFADRLLFIHTALGIVLQRHVPAIVAVEKVYFFKNITTAIDVSQARGVILLTARLQTIPLYEYTPLQVKRAVTGYGKADKQQVQKMVQILLSLPALPKPDDAADALALAICASTAPYNLS
ncbi:MAG: crossover junction endodeoxyribonuclease RuvC [Patescibacteria group bacterium]